MANRNFSRTFSALAKMFSKAGDEAIRDLEDSLDLPVESDQWNSADKGNRARTPVGPQEAMSGGRDGAERFVSDYATDHSQDQGLVQAYAGLAQALADQNKRVAGVEKSISAIAAYLAQTVKGEASQVFSTAADEEDDEEEDKNESDDRKESSAKSGMRTLTIPKLMKELSGYSRSGVKGLATPPNFALTKAGPSAYERIGAGIERLTNTNDSITASTLLSRLKMAENNQEAYGRFISGLNGASPEVQSIFRSGGVAVVAKSGPSKISFTG